MLLKCGPSIEWAEYAGQTELRTSKVRHRKKSVKFSKTEAAQILRPHQKTKRLLDPCSGGKTQRKETKRKATHNLDEQHR